MSELKPDESDLWSPTDHAGMRKRIEDSVIKEVQRVFPDTYGGVRLEVENPRLAGPERFTLKDQRRALMKREYLAKPLKADLVLKDAESGEELDRRENTTLMKVPYYTDRGTFIHNGNNYTGIMQSRMMPGAYTRVQNNGVSEVQINTRVGTGKAFRVALDPEKAQFRFRVKGSDLHLYSVLKDIGVDDQDIRKAWGDEVFEMNKASYDKRATEKAFGKMVPDFAKGDHITASDGVREALNRAQIAKQPTSRTLAAYWSQLRHSDKAASFHENFIKGLFKKSFDVRDQGDVDDEGDEYLSVGPEGLLAASKKLLAVNRGQDKPDERHIPAFAKVFTLDKLMGERIRLDEGRRRRVMMRRLAKRKSLDGFMPGALSGYLEDFLTMNSLTSPGEETNPAFLLSQNHRITQMGPGGIGSTDAVTGEMQAINASEFGFISPVEGPESSAAGIDVRMAHGVKVGKDGRLYRKYKNANTGSQEWLSPQDLWGKSVAIPD